MFNLLQTWVTMADFGYIASCLGPLVYLLRKIQIIWLSDLLIMNVPGEDFSSIVRTKFDIYVFFYYSCTIDLSNLLQWCFFNIHLAFK